MIAKIHYSLRLAMLSGAGAVLLTATPAAARDFNCFQWVKATAVHIIHPHPHPVHAAIHRTTGVPRRHIHRVRHIVHAARPHATPVNMIRKPIACPAHEVAQQSLAPGAAPPETADTLLAELAGPAAAPTATGSAIDTTALAPAPAAPEAVTPAQGEGSGIPGIFGSGGGGGPSGFVPGGGGGGPGGLGGPGFPGTPTPSVIIPPVIIPDTATPPVILPPDTTPVIGGPGTPGTTPPTPDVFPPPVVPPGGTPAVVLPGGVPEPNVWALLIVGFGAVGAALRKRRRVTAGRRCSPSARV